jgi:hypothetical protein
MNLRLLKLSVYLNWSARQQGDDRSSSVPSCCWLLHFAGETMNVRVYCSEDRLWTNFARNRSAGDPSCTDDSLDVPTGGIEVSTGTLGSWEKWHRRYRIVQFDVLPKVTTITQSRKSLPIAVERATDFGHFCACSAVCGAKDRTSVRFRDIISGRRFTSSTSIIRFFVSLLVVLC